MSKFYKKIFLFILFSVIFCSAKAKSGDIFSVNKSVELNFCGILRQEVHFGPPGFGEDPKRDSKIFVWVIFFEMPKFFLYKNESANDVKRSLGEIQLSLDSDNFNKNLRQYSGKRVIISGKLWSATSQGDTTPVVIAPSKIKLIN